jgi:uncharacterized membrane protein (UPF0136 family)
LFVPPIDHGEYRDSWWRPLAGPLSLLAIVAAAFVVRYIGLQHGYPLLINTDEWAIVEPAVRMSANRSLDPGFYGRPDLLSIYLSIVVFNVVSHVSFGQSVAASFEAHKFTYYFSARLITAVFGAALPVAAYFVAKTWRRSLAIPAALLFAFFPSYVIHSQDAAPDVPVSLLTLLVILSAALYVKSNQVRWLFLGSILAAANTAEKYPGLLSLGIVFGAILLPRLLRHERTDAGGLRSSLQRLGEAGAVFVVSFCLISPGLFLHLANTTRGILSETQSTHLGADGLGFIGNLAYYAKQYYDQGGPVLIGLAVLGAYVVIRSGEPSLFLAFYGMGYWIAMSALALHWERWALPMYTAPLLLAGVGFDYLRKNFKPPALRGALLAVGVAVILWLGLRSTAASVELSYPDTRWEALIYCRQKHITPENSVYELYTPFAPAWRLDTFPWDYAAITRKKYVILSSDMSGRYFNEPGRYASQVAIYRRIAQENELIAEFTPTPPSSTILDQIATLRYYLLTQLGKQTEARYAGPHVLIYRVTPSARIP